MRGRALPPRVADFGSLHESLLLSGVTTILVIRTQLWLTNYPELGGHGLHIAHLLWGGCFMLVAIGLLLTFLGRPVRRAAAIAGGVGFGFFIDELGKFITQDNDYFFRPAAALIYLIFIGLFMLARALQRHDSFADRDELANAVDLLGDAARHELDEPSRREALALLDRADPADPLVAPLRALFERAETHDAAPGRLARAAERGRELRGRLTAWPSFEAAVCLLFIVWAVLCAAGTVRTADLSFLNVATLVSTTASSALVAVGVVRLRAGDRRSAYRWFERALLVGIFVTQVFSFVESQFGAVFGLGVDLLLLWGLRAAHSGAGRVPAPAWGT